MGFLGTGVVHFLFDCTSFVYMVEKYKTKDAQLAKQGMESNWASPQINVEAYNITIIPTTQ